jgi:hypothetical protein
MALSRRGLGGCDATILDVPSERWAETMAAELRRLELARTDLLLDLVGDLSTQDSVLALGSDPDLVTSLISRFGCSVTLRNQVGPDPETIFDAVIHDDLSRKPGEVKQLAALMGAPPQPRARLVAALVSNGFEVNTIADLTRQALPYWQVRVRAQLGLGGEERLLAACASRVALLVFVVAEFCRRPSPPAPSPPEAEDAPRELPETHPFGLSYY